MGILAKQDKLDDDEDEDEDEEEDEDEGEPPFATAGTAHSCTQKCSSKDFTMNVNGRDYSIELTDTMGFPDPDVKKARRFYNEVVKECNKECNAILWVHKASRSQFPIIEQLKVLLREFNNCAPPIVLIMNGCEAHDFDFSQAKTKKKMETLLKKVEEWKQ